MSSGNTFRSQKRARDVRSEKAESSAIYLNFHGLGAPHAEVEVDERPYWLSSSRFAAILTLIRERDAAGRIRITFDDGNRSDVTVALPLLEEFGLGAAFFIVTERIGAPSYLGVADVARLHDAGMSIGSHGASHVPWTSLDDTELAVQVARSMRSLSQIVGRPVTEVAVPFGDYDRRVLGVLRRLGVSRAYTSDNGVASPGTWLAARNTMRSDTPLAAVEKLIVDGFDPVRRMRQSARRFAKRLRLSPSSARLAQG
jgi:peptidoglycan/xylan/chitin deacetylase (PgdA/CDA1 family)